MIEFDIQSLKKLEKSLVVYGETAGGFLLFRLFIREKVLSVRN